MRDQLRIIQSKKVEEQTSRLREERKKEKDDENKLVVARGIIALAAVGGSGVDPSLYPLGYDNASLLDEDAFSNADSALVLTAVGKDGPPVAAKRIALKDLKFPLLFELTSDDLIFPFNRDVYLGQKTLSQGYISVAAILDTDGKLVTPSPSNRFGFAISDPILQYPDQEDGSPRDPVVRELKRALQ